MSQPLHVLQICAALRWSGAAHQCLALSHAMEAAGDLVVVACQPGSLLQRRARAAGVRTVPVLMRGPGDVAAARTLRSYLTRHGVPVVHAHDGVSRALTALATLGSPAARVATCRHVGRPRRGLAGLHRRVGVDRWVAISPRVAAGLRTSGVRPGDVEVIAPGVALDGHAPRDAGRRGRILPHLGLAGHDGPLIGSVQQLDRREGLDQLVEATRRLRMRWPDLRVVIAGEGEQRQFIQALVARQRLSDVVRLPGWVEDGPGLLAALDAYVVPSFGEGDHVALATAQAAGCPVVATAVGDSEALVEHGRSGLVVPPGDGVALAEALHRVLSHPEWAEGLGLAAQRSARERSSLGAMIHAHRRMYSTLGQGRAVTAG